MNRQHYKYNTVALDSAVCVNSLCSPVVPSKLMGQPAPAWSATTTDLYTLYLFMDRWTCSRCWRLAKRLGQMQEWLEDHDISVVLVGPDLYFQQANKMAKMLHLPFKLVNDEHSFLKRIYGYGDCEGETHKQTLALVDQKGRRCHWRQIRASGKKRQLGDLRTAIGLKRSK